jgi:hypothetical protein
MSVVSFLISFCLFFVQSLFFYSDLKLFKKTHCIAFDV